MGEVGIPRKRPPVHPAEVLLEEFMKPIGMTAQTLAEWLGVPESEVQKLLNKERAIDPYVSGQLARLFGTTPGFWLGLQGDWDEHHWRRESHEGPF